MKHVILCFICLTIATGAHSAQAQNPWNLEVRGAVASATKDFGDADLDTGFGFETTLAYFFMPHLAAYVGWGWHQFTADKSFAGEEADFDETGYRFGLQFVHPIGDTNLSYLLSAGGLYNHIEMENKSNGLKADSGHRFGWEIGVGLVIPLSENWQLVPSFRYELLSSSFDFQGVDRDFDLSYLSYGVSVSWSF